MSKVKTLFVLFTILLCVFLVAAGSVAYASGSLSVATPEADGEPISAIIVVRSDSDKLMPITTVLSSMRDVYGKEVPVSDFVSAVKVICKENDEIIESKHMEANDSNIIDMTNYAHGNWRSMELVAYDYVNNSATTYNITVYVVGSYPRGEYYSNAYKLNWSDGIFSSLTLKYFMDNAGSNVLTEADKTLSDSSNETDNTVTGDFYVVPGNGSEPSPPTSAAKPTTYTVYYNANGGSGAPKSQTKTHGYSLTLRSSVPNREGYTFAGWNTKSNGTGKNYSAGGQYTTNASVTLYAQWSAKSYTITYDSNGGGVIGTQSQKHGESIKLPGAASTIEGMIFAGWNTKANGSGKNYFAGASFKPNANVTLYAQWKLATYTITYSANGGSNVPAAQTKTHNAAMTLTGAIPVREYYKFVCWNTEKNGGGKSYNPGEEFDLNCDVTLYAQWEATSLGVNSAAVRFAGSDRFSTASSISANTFSSSKYAVLASAEGFADALAGVPLAYALDAPILLVGGTELNYNTLVELVRLGVEKVYILGGESVVEKNVADNLTSRGYAVERIFGSNRFETSVKVAEILETVTGKQPYEVFFVSAYNYPDALSVSSIAAMNGSPILYINSTGDVEECVEEYLSGRSIVKATIIGGSTAISTDFEKNIKQLASITVNRIAGTNRYETCIKVNQAYSHLFNKDYACLATGSNYPDALAGGVFAAVNKAPVVLVSNSLQSSLVNYIRQMSPETLYVFGGKSAVSEEMVSAFVK